MSLFQSFLFSRVRIRGWTRWASAALGVVLLMLGAGTGWFGVQLIGVGGTWYYAVAALLMLVASVAMLAGYAAAGVRLQALLVAVTFLWASWEIAGKGFLPMWGLDLAARLGVIGVLYLLSAVILSLGTAGPGARTQRRAAIGMTAAVAAVAATVVVLHWERTVPPLGEDRAAPVQPPQMLAGLNEEDEWAAFGGSAHGQRFTPARQITPHNVSELSEAWRFRTGDLPDSDRIFFSSQNTPILAEGRLFACSPSNKVFALDPTTGQELWSYDPEVREEDMESLFSVACRSVAHYRVPEAAGQCASRIYLATVDSRLTALDAGTGQICTEFGDQGTVDLSVDMDLQEVGFASSTSGPALVGDALIVGQQVSDNQRRDAPSGVVRAYDPVTGRLRWHWDALLQGQSQDALAEGEIYPRGTPNVWNIISGDPEAGIVYLGTGNSANDHFGGTRTPNEDRFTAAVVAVDLATGETIWEYATVIHDLWDYDIGAQPIVADVMVDGARRRAVIQGTKTGSLFVLDAATGAPLTEIEQRPAPQGALPGDWVSPTQPQSVRYANLSGLPGPDPERLDARHAFGVSPVDAAMCRLEFERMEYRGIYTPPTDSPGGMLLFPGTVGGMNWGGLGYDRDRNILITNHSRLPNKVIMHPRDEVDDLPVGMGGARPDQTVAPHYFSPWGVDRPMWLSPLSVPCIAPPWGILAATDLDSGELLWSQPIGTGFDIGPLGIPTFLKVAMGTPNLGGSVVTASGLTFIAAAQDNWLRAFETATGRLLWQGRLPAGGQASPMSYVAEGRQYVVIAATGHGQLETEIGDYIVAFALPLER